MIYTHGITDIDYYRPVFSTIIIMAEYIYCVRDPYVSVIYAAGRFKETSLSAYIEAGINIVLSIILVIWFGLEGIAVGTFIGMTYRMIYMVVYLSKHVIYRPVYKSVKRLVLSLAAMGCSLGLMFLVDTTGSATLWLWIKNAVLSVAVFGTVTLIFDLIFDRELTLSAFRSLLKRNNKNA
jgi:peptidoglycan biosynthesis protein MviN/MurJ (putative lipid II flippase)